MFTRMPCLPSACAAPLVRETTPPFDIQYELKSTPTTAARDDTLTTEPLPAFIIIGTTVFIPTKGPHAFVFIIESKSSFVVLS